jgi:NAD(P)H-hydrate epimerase
VWVTSRPSRTFTTAGGVPVAAVTAGEMRELDRVAVNGLGLGILQMMENAGRNLADLAIEMVGRRRERITILAGGGGNGGGGLCCARHLLNHGNEVAIVLDRQPTALTGAARSQYHVLASAGQTAATDWDVVDLLVGSTLVVDALIGYSLRGAPRGRASDLIELCNQHARAVLSLDLPSGLDATTGETPGASVRADTILTLALPKTGLQLTSGELFLADIGIPPQAFERIGIEYTYPFGDAYRVRLVTAPGSAGCSMRQCGPAVCAKPSAAD